MHTVIETPTFTRLADKIWSEDERLEFITFIAKNATAGDVIPGAEGARKIRWTTKNSGKRGGVRVIYFNQDEQGTIYLITLYVKPKKTNITAKEIKQQLYRGKP
jgi:mRNA-degrading endonuclease RelE of RelBE toxin-antitoxin system